MAQKNILGMFQPCDNSNGVPTLLGWDMDCIRFPHETRLLLPLLNMFRRMVIAAVENRLKCSIWVIALQMCFWVQEVARHDVYGVGPAWDPLKSHLFPVCIAKGFQASEDGKTRSLLEVITQSN